MSRSVLVAARRTFLSNTPLLSVTRVSVNTRAKPQTQHLTQTRMSSSIQVPEVFSKLLNGNKSYCSDCKTKTPELNAKLGKGQTPKILWLGCADSRVPETTISNSLPGDIFVHRNIANIITSSDVSANSVMDFAVGVVGVEEIIVCGHTKCGGAKAGLGDGDLGPNLNSWVGPLRELRKKHQSELDALDDADAKMTRLAELNVMLSIAAVKENKTVQNAIKERGLTIHGVIYDIPEGEIYVLDDAGKKTDVSVDVPAA